MTDATTLDRPEPDDSLDAALRAAYGSASSLLSALRGSDGPARPIRLREADPAPDDPTDPGAGRYRVETEIARGGIGVVLRGRDRDLGRDVALKVLRDEHAADPEMVRRLVEEAQIGGQLQHPGVPPVFEIGLDPSGRPFFAMKLLSGPTLRDLLDRRPDPGADRRRFLGIVEAIAQTVAYAHARGVIHRDLKPGNVMVGGFGEVLVVDWGLARVLPRPGDAPEDRPAEPGWVVGTPGYMAPEQARGEPDRIDERTDVFALGAILFEVLTGRPPLVGSRTEVVRRTAEGNLDEAFRLLADAPADAELVRLCRRCLDPDPAARPPDAAAVAAELSTYLSAVEDRARAAELEAARARERAEAERRARRRTVALGTAAVAAVALAAGGWTLAERRRLAAAQEAARADSESLRAERAERRRLESALALLLPLETKTRYLLDGAALVQGPEAARWADLLLTCRGVAERAAENAPDPRTRERFQALVEQLSREEAALRGRFRSAELLFPPRESAGP